MLAIFLSIENERERQTAEDIWNRYEKQMYKIAINVLKKDEEAKDAVMDAVCSMIRNIKKFIDLAELDTVCLLTIYVKNAALKIYNKNKRIMEYVIDAENIDLLSEHISVEDIVVTKAEYECLAKNLQNISEMYSHPFLLKHHYDFSIKEIATTLALNEETVKKRLYRAKQQLIEMMEQDYA